MLMAAFEGVYPNFTTSAPISDSVQVDANLPYFLKPGSTNERITVLTPDRMKRIYIPAKPSRTNVVLTVVAVEKSNVILSVILATLGLAMSNPVLVLSGLGLFGLLILAHYQRR